MLFFVFIVSVCVRNVVFWSEAELGTGHGPLCAKGVGKGWQGGEGGMCAVGWDR